MGRLAGKVLELVLPSINIDPGTMALIGAASVLGGVVRMTMSVPAVYGA